MEIPLVVAQRVRELREAQGMSQRGLAYYMGTLDHPVDRSAIVRIEKGERRVSASEFLALALSLDVHPFELLNTDDGTLDIGEWVSLSPDQVQRWFVGERAVSRDVVAAEYEAGRFVEAALGRRLRPDDIEWAKHLAETVLGNDDLRETFQEATTEPKFRRERLMHLVMSTAAYGGEFRRDGWDRPGEEGETE